MRDEWRDNEEVPEQVVRELDAAAEGVSPLVLQRLATARKQAVLVAEQRERRWLRIPRWVTAGGVATTAVLVIASSIWFSSRRENPPAVMADDLEIISTFDQLDLYEDLDFYLWLTEKGSRHE